MAVLLLPAGGQSVGLSNHVSWSFKHAPKNIPRVKIIGKHHQIFVAAFVLLFLGQYLLFDATASSVFEVTEIFAGMANAACAAIDSMNHGEILGTIAGDDTIFIVISEQASEADVVSALSKVVPNMV